MEQPIAQYNKFGGKTLYVFIAKYANLIFGSIVLTGLIVYGLKFLPESIQHLVSPINYSVIGLGTLIILGAVLAGWLEYSHYRIEIYNDFLKIMRGVFVIEEIGIPYKRIVEIKIHRTLAEQMMGLANIQIAIFREDDKTTSGNDSIIMLPALTDAIANQIQHSILERANINETAIEAPSSNLNS